MANRTWIRDFTNLYFSANEKDIAKALKLKEIHFPKKTISVSTCCSRK